jgi:hypothetical protein
MESHIQLLNFTIAGEIFIREDEFRHSSQEEQENNV